MSKFGILVGTALSALVGLAGQSAFAASAITIQTDETQMIAVTEDPGTVVVGNPSIADVSVNGKQIFLHGRGFGNTNILVLDNNGNQMANFEVTVTHDASNEVVMMTAAPSKPIIYRESYMCAPNCFKEMVPGDVTFDKISQDNKTKTAIATGSKSSDVAPPQAPTQ